MVYLTEEKLHAIALDAREGLRDCLKMIALHNRDRANAFLNPGIALSAVAVWERFIVDACVASSDPLWSVPETGWFRDYDSSVPWPGSRPDRRAGGKGHHVNALLVASGALTSPLTDSWNLHVATDYIGADPTEWKWAEYASSPAGPNRDVIQAALLGARSARDAAAHRLYYKKAHQAQGYSKRPGILGDQADQRDWCYVWQSDNTYKSKKKDDGTPTGRGKPTIQHGYARGVVALVIQLVDITVERLKHDQGWSSRDSQLPSGWFRQTMPAGQPCAGEAVWNGQELSR